MYNRMRFPKVKHLFFYYTKFKKYNLASNTKPFATTYFII